MLKDVLVDTYLAFDEGLLAGHVLVLSPAEFEGGALDVGEDLGIIEELSTYIEEELPGGVVAPALPYVGRYLGEALARVRLRDGCS